MLRRNALILAPHLLLSSALAPGRGTARAQARAEAGPEGRPGGERVVLSVSGLVAPRAEGGEHHFTLAALEALGLTSLQTETPWTQGSQTFSGVPLEQLMRAVGARGEELVCTALNRYHTIVPRRDGTENGALLATRLLGQPMRVRELGPVWLVYPWSARPDLQNQTFHERAIWQLRHIEVR